MSKGNATIDIDSIKEHSKVVPEHRLTDNVKLFQALLLKQLPAERCNGLINLIYATRPSANESEIQSALVNTTLLYVKWMKTFDQTLKLFEHF